MRRPNDQGWHSHRGQALRFVGTVAWAFYNVFDQVFTLAMHDQVHAFSTLVLSWAGHSPGVGRIEHISAKRANPHVQR